MGGQLPGGMPHPSEYRPPGMADYPGAGMSDYQYQQQQMFYARDNRRPRRIACTCPNCRDGDNKMVTTKDGKQRKLHICHVPGCGKIYGKTSHLRAHLRWHAGERPFACNWLFCNKRFTRSDELQRHRRTHTGDKRFQCRTCLKKFMRSDHLSKHQKTHAAHAQGKTTANASKTTTTNTLSKQGNTQAALKKEGESPTSMVTDLSSHPGGAPIMSNTCVDFTSSVPSMGAVKLKGSVNSSDLGAQLKEALSSSMTAVTTSL